MGLTEYGPSGHSQETSGFRMYLKAQRGSIDDVVSPRGNGRLFGCQTVPIGCDKYVIRSVSLFVHMVAAAVIHCALE